MIELGTICSLESIGHAEIASVGAKAAALGELARAGFKVPPGFVLTTAAYDRVVEQMRGRIDARVTAEVIADPAEIEEAAREVREWIERAPWPDSLHSELANALAPFAAGGGEVESFAVRTSLPSEELATAFGAGVQRAFLGLVGLENIERGAARCWGALWTSRSMYYRHRKKIPQTSVALAVLVQPLVRADAAGVMFTQDMATGDRGVIQIDSIWGLGAPLLQARVQPDRFLIGKSDEVIRERQIAEKTVRLTIASNGAAEQQVVADDQAAAPSLADSQVAALARLGKRIEEFFGEPQDVEWARQGDEFYVLQSRPIAVRAS